MRPPRSQSRESDYRRAARESTLARELPRSGDAPHLPCVPNSIRLSGKASSFDSLPDFGIVRIPAHALEDQRVVLDVDREFERLLVSRRLARRFVGEVDGLHVLAIGDRTPAPDNPEQLLRFRQIRHARKMRGSNMQLLHGTCAGGIRLL